MPSIPKHLMTLHDKEFKIPRISHFILRQYEQFQCTQVLLSHTVLCDQTAMGMTVHRTAPNTYYKLHTCYSTGFLFLCVTPTHQLYGGGHR